MTTHAPVLDRLLPTHPADGVGARARSWLEAHGMPSARDEAWRYTPVDEILATLESAVPAEPRALSRAVGDDLAGTHGGLRFVFVNGVLAPDISDRDMLPPGLWCGTFVTLAHDGPLPSDWSDDASLVDGFQALNRAAGRVTMVVQAEPGVEVPDPIHVVHIAAPHDGCTVSHPHTSISAGDGSRLHVIETYTGLPHPTVTNAVSSIRVGSGANLVHHRIQTEAPDAIHVGHTDVDQSAASRFTSTSVMLGAAIARNAIDVRVHGADARSTLTGLYLPAGRQRHDTTISVDHAASHCTSTQEFKGVVDDHARGSFSGRIVVRPDTVGTDARQSNRNLLLSADAQADSRPWLEILADDVRCAHGTTVGRLDDEALFYLRTRGIPLAQGRSMLVDAFVREIVDAIEPASLRDHVTAALAARARGARA